MSLLRLIFSIMLIGLSSFAMAATTDGTTTATDDQNLAANQATAAPTASKAQASAVNINTATVADLTKVKGLGKRRAQAIVDYRAKNGNFTSVAELKNVTGPHGVRLFNNRSLSRLKNRLTV